MLRDPGAENCFFFKNKFINETAMDTCRISVEGLENLEIIFDHFSVNMASFSGRLASMAVV